MKGMMRRKDREMQRDEALEFLRECHVGRLGTASPEGVPYVTPVNYVFFDEDIYFHCALSGHKLENIKENENVCFEVDELISIVEDENPCEISTKYKSVVAFGKASIVEDDEVRLEALKKLVDKYVSENNVSSKLTIDKMTKTRVVKIKPEIITGKASIK
ncbi:pyridoxamine 5'-phosphate oxidase [Oxobacter pfennigii]|uniref:Pyridoxamine 5'-phosphate oxidase n=1 Tax=Oxobacter pfennigii TaxID=36849 RepID=A0A0P8W6H0_9CLOT|nr:pyridoxamine 5'-phosphate oxidase family protein [Oxobacter pfennigii]KPU43605.1 pyridoxamine 5'-phosphate oxidase [Oxobacter pfennigii]